MFQNVIYTIPNLIVVLLNLHLSTIVEHINYNIMKTFRNLLVFMLTYMMATTFVWILVMDTMTWHSIANDAVMIFVGGLISIFVTVCFAIEQSEKED